MNIKKIFLSFMVMIFLTNCAGSSPKPVSPLENVLAQFEDIETPPNPSPLTVVPIPRPSETPTDDDYYAFRLERGNQAPFNGILLSDRAAAFVLTEHEAVYERFALALNQQLEMDFARLVRDRNELYLQINSDRARFRLIISTQQRHIQDLNTIIENKNTNFWEKFWLVVGGIGTGLIIGVVAGFFVAQ